MGKEQITYVYCHECNELLFKGKQEIALGYSAAISAYPILGHIKHSHTVGKLWYFKRWHPEIDVSEWEEKPED